MRKLPLLLCLAVAALPASAMAQDAAPAETSGTFKLSEAEKEKLLDKAVEERELLEEVLPPPRRQIHGEVGVAIGTGGFRSIYGTSVVPLGEDGTAIISLEHTDWGNQNYRRRHRR